MKEVSSSPARLKASAKYRKTNREKCRESEKRWRRNLKREVINHYGGLCACCGETKFEFMTIDHINGDGAKHRERMGPVKSFYLRLKQAGWPTGLQVLCMNCNFSYGKYGYCPHKTIDNEGDCL